jgi:hypothetical protein
VRYRLKRVLLWMAMVWAVNDALTFIGHHYIMTPRMDWLGEFLCRAAVEGRLEQYNADARIASWVAPMPGFFDDLIDLHEVGDFAEGCTTIWVEGDASCGTWDSFFSIARSERIKMPDGSVLWVGTPEDQFYRPSGWESSAFRYLDYGQNYSLELVSKRGGRMFVLQTAPFAEGLMNFLFGFGDRWLHIRPISLLYSSGDWTRCPAAQRIFEERIRQGIHFIPAAVWWVLMDRQRLDLYGSPNRN